MNTPQDAASTLGDVAVAAGSAVADVGDAQPSGGSGFIGLRPLGMCRDLGIGSLRFIGFRDYGLGFRV